MITITDLSLNLSGRTLYRDVNLKFTPGNCYGVIGANGAGKSTFLKLLEGKMSPTTGTISIGPNERMTSLNQDHFAFDDCTVMDTVIQGHAKLYQIMQEKDALYAKPDFSDEDGVKVAELEAEFAEMDGWNAEANASQLLQSLGIPESLHDTLMGELAESDKVKVLLAQALFDSPDILLLDEPTNGLDVHTIAWLEDFLAGYDKIVIVVSHDRHFLNQVCTQMCDVDFQKIKLYVGNYDFWYESSQLAAQLAANQNAKKEEKIKELQEFIARFSANASKHKQATSRKKQLEKITLEDIQPSMRKYPYIKFEQDRPLGNDLLKVEHISHTVDGEKLLNDVSFLIRPGEKVRCLLSKMMLQHANVLLMDDPTNHLDLESITALNDAMESFPGSILFTSHDHEFIQTIADHLIEVGPNGFVSRADTTYDDFLAHPTAQKQVAALYE